MSLTTQAFEEIYRHAEYTYPDECCGFVLADGSVYGGINIQNELHAAHPEIYRRTAANGYTFSVANTVFLNNSLKTQNPVAIIYHSHPTCWEVSCLVQRGYPVIRQESVILPWEIA